MNYDQYRTKCSLTPRDLREIFTDTTVKISHVILFSLLKSKNLFEFRCKTNVSDINFDQISTEPYINFVAEYDLSRYSLYQNGFLR